MSDRLPPLKALRVFVAIARHQSVSRAAAELHLTHSAVSHQLRLLQQETGSLLVERSGRGLRLTPAGAAYADRVDRAFAEIEAATRALLGRPRELRVSAMPSFAARWLLPRLGDFVAAHPAIDIVVQSTQRLADLKGGEVDVALRFGRGDYPGLHVETLLADWYAPMCSPDFAARHGLDGLAPAALAARLGELPLLRSDNEPWSLWFAATGVSAAEPQRGLLFNDSSLMLAAAASGQGLCLGRHSIAADDLAAGRLRRPCAAIAASPNSNWFVCRPGDLEVPAIAAFRSWLRERAAAMPAGGQAR